MKTALVYDRVNKWGGAERVLLVLNELFPDAQLYTSLYSPEKAPWARVFPRVIPSFLQKIPFLNEKHELLAPFMPLAFESFNFDEYDLVISVASEAAKGIITKPSTLHICYCLTPTRYLWSHYDTYFKKLYFKVISKPFVSYLRTWDKIAAQRPDVVVGISTAVQRRIRKYYGRESELIYPPVDLSRFQTLKKSSPQAIKNYYLLVSRLVSYKRVDLAIEAFNALGLPLVIVGTGSEEKKLKSISRKNITFTGFVKEDDLPTYYKNAKALIFPQEEDFGITAIEAQASGCPVIAYKKGGALDTVIEEKTGIFFDEQNVESLKKAVSRFHVSIHRNMKKEDCVKNAQKFSKEIFKKEFNKLVEKVMSSQLQ